MAGSMHSHTSCHLDPSNRFEFNHEGGCTWISIVAFDGLAAGMSMHLHSVANCDSAIAAFQEAKKRLELQEEARTACDHRDEVAS